MSNDSLSFYRYLYYYLDLSELITKLYHLQDFSINLQNFLNNTVKNNFTKPNEILRLNLHVKQLNKAIKNLSTESYTVMSQFEHQAEAINDIEYLNIVFNRIHQNVECILLLKLSCEIQAIILLDYDLNNNYSFKTLCILEKNFVLFEKKQSLNDISNNYRYMYIKTKSISSLLQEKNIVSHILVAQNNSSTEKKIFLKKSNRLIVENKLFNKPKLNILSMISFCIIGILICLLAIRFDFGMSKLLSTYTALCFTALLITAVYSVFYFIKKRK